LSAWASAGIEPDRVVLLRTSASEAAARLARRSGDQDRLEGEEAAFFRRVDEGYLALASADPDRWRVVDGEGMLDEVAARVTQAATT
jgi:dTMP kinase